MSSRNFCATSAMSVWSTTISTPSWVSASVVSSALIALSVSAKSAGAASASSWRGDRHHVLRRLQVLVVVEQHQVEGDDVRLRGADLRNVDRARCSGRRRSRCCTAASVSTSSWLMSMPYTSFRPGPQTGLSGQPCGQAPDQLVGDAGEVAHGRQADIGRPSPAERRSRRHRCPGEKSNATQPLVG